MATGDALDAFAGWSLLGVGAIAVFAAWNNVEGGAIGLIKDTIRTGHVTHGVARTSSGDGTTGTAGPAPTDTAQAAAEFALAQRGKPYRWAATGPDSYDCSGLMYASYKHAGVTIPRTTFLQIHAGVEVSGAPQIGDLVFPSHEHVMMALGDGTAVEAPHTGDVVKVVDLGDLSQYISIRRITKVSKRVQQSNVTNLRESHGG